MNRTKITLADYIALIKMIKPDWAVSPIEEIDMNDVGRKKMQRAVRHSILTFEDVTKDAASITKWIAPVLVEDPKMLTSESVTSETPILLYGG